MDTDNTMEYTTATGLGHLIHYLCFIPSRSLVFSYPCSSEYLRASDLRAIIVSATTNSRVSLRYVLRAA